VEEDEVEDRRKDWGATSDVFECKDCGHVGPALAPVNLEFRSNSPGVTAIRYLDEHKMECEDCCSHELELYIRGPTVNQRRAMRHGHDKVAALDETDPDWAERFNHDADRAYDFYFKP
jgi:hypothetical protein